MTRRFASIARRTIALTLLLGAAAQAQSQTAARALPERLTDAEFWKLVNDISEPGGQFRIVDNFTSNEPEIGVLFSRLRQQGVSGGVYIGVGPEQNLTYIASIRPKMAFICDIRRQAVMHHLMYKAMFELSKDRADFISILFGLPRPAGLDSSTSIQAIWTAYSAVRTDSALSAKNYTRVLDQLLKVHKFTFTADESSKFQRVFEAFQWYGPGITTQSGSGGMRGGGGGMNGRTFVDLTGYSVDTANVAQSFLSTEDNYRYVKSMHEKNLIVAVSGDFGGPKALRAIGTWIKERGSVVRAFYVSNVEQYLFQDFKSETFYDNVASFPVDSGSVFIRPYSMRRGFGGEITPLCPIAVFVQSVTAGRVRNNNDALACPR